ncbi:MAG: hypothetical protein ABH878_02265, partial [bacterium]
MHLPTVLVILRRLVENHGKVSIFNHRLRIALLAVLIICASASAWIRQPNWILPTETMIWLATPGGLIRYDPENELFLPEELFAATNIQPTEIASDGAQLWVLADSSVAYLDLYAGGRYQFTSADGLPTGKLRCLAIAEDYVWVGGDSGAARFDRLIEQWEVLTVESSGLSAAARQISQILPTEEFVYLASGNGILRFDPRTETFDSFSTADGLKCSSYFDLRRLGDEIWCFGDSGIDIYSSRQKNWTFLGQEQGFRSTEWLDVELIGGKFYLLFKNGVDVCEPSNHRIQPFDREDRLIDFQIYDLTGGASEIWFAADRGLLRYQLENSQIGQAETWVLYDPARGASQSGFQRVAGSGKSIFAEGEAGIDVLDTQTEIFQAPFLFLEHLAGSKTEATYPQVHWDDRGLRLLPGAQWETGLQGEFSAMLQLREDETNDRLWGRLQPFLRHTSGRSLSGLYDNTNPDETLYGATYRGAQNDLLRRIQGGNRIYFDLTHNPFFGATTLRGADAMLEVGERSGTKRRSLLRSNFTYGQLLTHSAREFFTGAQGPVYLLKHQDVLIGSAKVYLNNRLLGADEYTLNHTLGRLFFIFSGWELLNEGDLIEVQYQYRLDDEQIGESLTAGEIILSRGDALQVTLGAFQKGTNPDSSNAAANFAGSEFSAAQISAEARGEVLGVESALTAGLGAGTNPADQTLHEAGYVEGNFHYGSWTLGGKWLHFSDSLETLEDRSTEFGFLRSENGLNLRFEPSGRLLLESGSSEKRGQYGSERSYRLGGQFAPVPGTSSFGDLEYFDANSDSLKRERWIASLGVETAFFPALLKSLRIRSSKLLLLGKLTQVSLDTLPFADSTRMDLQTQSLLARWALVPGAKTSFYPEVRWSSQRRGAAGDPLKKDREELAPRFSLYTRNLIPGLATYVNGEANYSQAGFDAAQQRNVKLERQGIARLDLTPGTYLKLLSPFSLRLDFARNAQDSLIGIDEEYSLFDLGFRWSDFPANVASQRLDSDGAQITWAAHRHWLLYQSLTSVRSSAAPEQQFFSTRIEWKPRFSDQVLFRYTLNRTLAVLGDELRHRPGLE